MSWFNESSNVAVTRRTQPKEMRDGLFNLVDNFFRDWDTSISTVPNLFDKFIPPLSVSENENGYVIETELPGVKKKDISVDLYDNVLTIKGEKKAFEEEKKGSYYRMERNYGSFLRSIRLPQSADDQKVQAKMEDGVLHIEVAKTAEAAKKKRFVSIN